MESTMKTKTQALSVSRPTISVPPPKVGDRPQCPWCEKRLQPIMYQTTERVDTPPARGAVRVNGSHNEVITSGGFFYRTTSKYWSGTYRAYGAFCSLGCCEAYANAEFKRTGTRYRLPKS